MEFISGNVFIRPIILEKVGDIVEGHEHNFDHTTYIVKGSIKIDRLKKTDSGEYEVERSVIKKASDGYNWVLIKAGVRHKLEALEDNSLGHCIYAHRTPMGDIVQEYDGWADAYR